MQRLPCRCRRPECWLPVQRLDCLLLAAGYAAPIGVRLAAADAMCSCSRTRGRSADSGNRKGEEKANKKRKSYSLLSCNNREPRRRGEVGPPMSSGDGSPSTSGPRWSSAACTPWQRSVLPKNLDREMVYLDLGAGSVALSAAGCRQQRSDGVGGQRRASVKQSRIE